MNKQEQNLSDEKLYNFKLWFENEETKDISEKTNMDLPYDIISNTIYKSADLAEDKIYLNVEINDLKYKFQKSEKEKILNQLNYDLFVNKYDLKESEKIKQTQNKFNIQIGVYSDVENKNVTPANYTFDSIDEMKVTLEMMMAQYKDDPYLVVRESEGKQATLLNQDSYYALVSFVNEVSKNQTVKPTIENNFNINQNSTIMKNQNFNQDNSNKSLINNLSDAQKKTLDILTSQVKYLGFGESENIREDIAKGILNNDANFIIKVPAENNAFIQNKIEFNLRFANNEKGTFFNSYEGALSNTKTGEEKIHNFPVRANAFTAKEAVNLLEGRSVKKEFENKENQKTFSFIRLNFKEKLNEGNYKFNNVYPNQVKPTAELLNEVQFKNKIPEEKLQSLIKLLEKGNVVRAEFIYKGEEHKGNIVLNPVNNQISLYSENMVRLNPTKQNQITPAQENEMGKTKQYSNQRSI